MLWGDAGAAQLEVPDPPPTQQKNSGAAAQAASTPVPEAQPLKTRELCSLDLAWSQEAWHRMDDRPKLHTVVLTRPKLRAWPTATKWGKSAAKKSQDSR